jgi:hypothetical protein
MKSEFLRPHSPHLAAKILKTVMPSLFKKRVEVAFFDALYCSD